MCCFESISVRRILLLIEAPTRITSYEPASDSPFECFVVLSHALHSLCFKVITTGAQSPSIDALYNYADI